MSHEISLRKKFSSILEYWQFIYDNFLCMYENKEQLINGKWTSEEYEIVKKVSSHRDLDEEISSEEIDAYLNIISSSKFNIRSLSSILSRDTILNLFEFTHPNPITVDEEENMSDEEFETYSKLDRNIPYKFEREDLVKDSPFIINIWEEKDGRDGVSFFDCYPENNFEEILEVKVY